jgi:tetratricopeptide (TPR) repeat protein
VPLLLIALVFGILSLSLQRGSRWFYGLDVHPLPARAAQCLYGIVFYVWKTLLPTGLCPLHELPIPLNPVQARFAWCAMLILCAAAALVVWRRRAGARALTAALLWYLVFIIPVLGLLQNGPQIVADRFSLLATLGFPIVAAAGLHALCGRVSHALARVLLVTSATGVIALLAALTWRQCAVWRDDLSLWSAVVARAPESAMGHAGLGLAQVEHGLYADGIAHYRMAIALQPRLGMAHERLWTAIQRQGAPPRELLEALQHSRRVYPEFVPAMLRLGDAHLQRGEADEALMEFRAAVAAAPDHAPAHAALALAHLRRGELDAAIAASAAALDRDPVCLPAMLARAEVHRLRGETDDALRLLRRAVETAPGDAESRRRLDALEHVRPRD